MKPSIFAVERGDIETDALARNDTIPQIFGFSRELGNRRRLT